MCATENVKKLVENFEEEYKSAILDAIINGKQLTTMSEIESIARFSNPRYKEMMDSLNFMTQERENIEDDISSDLVGVSNYLFDTETKVLRQLALFYRESAINKAAHDLTMLNESKVFTVWNSKRKIQPCGGI